LKKLQDDIEAVLAWQIDPATYGVDDGAVDHAGSRDKDLSYLQPYLIVSSRGEWFSNGSACKKASQNLHKVSKTDHMKEDPAVKQGSSTPRTQAQRSSRTRRVVCEAVLDSLVEMGWEGVSTTVVAKRAKLSRGALVHQYPTRNDMFVAAYRYLINHWRTGFPFNTGPDYVHLSIEEMIDAMWRLIYLDKWFPAAMELLLVADKDSDLSRRLNEVFEEWVVERDSAAMKILGIDPEDTDMVDLFQLTLATLRGVALFQNASGDPEYARRHMERWKKMAKASMAADRPSGLSVLRS
jgi:AcrR family transcriptional regulator